jgi:hypothetical protein
VILLVVIIVGAAACFYFVRKQKQSMKFLPKKTLSKLGTAYESSSAVVAAPTTEIPADVDVENNPAAGRQKAVFNPTQSRRILT